MQKITVKTIKEFIASTNIPFFATQSKLCVPIIYRMCQKMSHGIRFDDIKVCENLIIDGHHRYLSALIVDFKLGQVDSNSTPATKVTAWDLVKFDDEDWDTPAKIAYLNALDAKYNNVEIELINQIISG